MLTTPLLTCLNNTSTKAIICNLCKIVCNNKELSCLDEAMDLQDWCHGACVSFTAKKAQKSGTIPSSQVAQVGLPR